MSDIRKTFRFVSYLYDFKNTTAYLKYAVDELIFEEKLVFPGAKKNLSEAEVKAIEHILFYVHLAAGISYYKAFIPEKIAVETRPLSQAAAQFFETFYLKGLGEFAFKNNLDLSKRIHFPFRDSTITKTFPLNLKRRTAIPIGGGKDSVVTLEALKRNGESIVGLAVGRHKTIVDVALIASVPLYEVQRYLSPVLFECNKRGAFNGHVPIVGILSFVFVMAAILYGYDSIAMSNERSAESGNVIHFGREVNHQWSKSLEFESEFNKLMKQEITSDITYFSFLRPLSEFHIAAIFSALKKYHPHFSSCNRGYKIIDANEVKWCGECDKCRFVFFALAPFLPKEEILRIFSRDLLGEVTNVVKFKELLGIEGYKPFECVGEFEESQAALYLLSNSLDWKESPVVLELMHSADQKKMDLRKSYEKTMAISENLSMPDRYERAFHEISRLAESQYHHMGSRT